MTANTEYDLEVLASNASGDSAAASVTVSTLPNAPAAPTGLTTSGITQTGITLSWTKSTSATAYKVRKDSGDSWTVLGDVATHSFTGLTANTQYTLEVVASNAGGDSTAASVSATTNNVPPPPAPAAPTSLTTSGITQTGITLSWTKSTGATAYKVRKDSGDSWTVLGDVATYSFTGLTANTQYTLEALASNAGGDSAAASVTAVTVPAAPTGLSTSGITQTGITLTWTKSAGATAYKARKDSADSWTTLGDVATYTFTGLTAGQQCRRGFGRGVG
ncbi:MAG: fibronectin type III domain-containing protein [Anaerolineae bacterium]|nr:fibronectin type III domain-containing protein [Anaerolineae bacterium]